MRLTPREMIDDMLMNTPKDVMEDAIDKYNIDTFKYYHRGRHKRMYGYQGGFRWSNDADAAIRLYVSVSDTIQAEEIAPKLRYLRKMAGSRSINSERRRAYAVEYNELSRVYNSLMKGVESLRRRWNFLRKKKNH